MPGRAVFLAEERGQSSCLGSAGHSASCLVHFLVGPCSPVSGGGYQSCSHRLFQAGSSSCVLSFPFLPLPFPQNSLLVRSTLPLSLWPLPPSAPVPPAASCHPPIPPGAQEPDPASQQGFKWSKCISLAFSPRSGSPGVQKGFG